MTNPRPPSDRFPPTEKHLRTPQERIPTLLHLLPAWYPRDLFIGEYYSQQLGDNTIYHDEASARHAATNALNNASGLHNFFYKQELPHDRPDRHDTVNKPHQKALTPDPEAQSDYSYELPDTGERGHVPTGSHQ